MLTMLRPHRPPWSIFIDIYSLFEIQNVINLNMCHSPGDYQSLDARKIYECVFRPVKRTKRMLFMQNSLKR